MKILLCNRDPELWVGGDAVQVQETMEALKRLGHTVDFSSNTYKDPREYDAVHIFNVNFFWTTPMAWECQKHHIPYIISPIYFDREYDNTFGTMSKILTKAKAILPLSEAERDQMINRMGIKEGLFTIVPNGVNKQIFTKKEVVHKNRVLAVGRLSDPMKGAHLIALACKELNLKLTYVGASSSSRFSQETKALIHTHIEYATKEELAKLYQESRLYVCSSLSERQSLGVLEAAACGCPIVDSIHNLGNDLLPSSVVVNPENTEELKQAITKQWIAPRNTDFVPSWDDIANQLVEIYER